MDAPASAMPRVGSGSRLHKVPSLQEDLSNINTNAAAERVHGERHFVDHVAGSSGDGALTPRGADGKVHGAYFCANAFGIDATFREPGSWGVDVTFRGGAGDATSTNASAPSLEVTPGGAGPARRGLSGLTGLSLHAAGPGLETPASQSSGNSHETDMDREVGCLPGRTGLDMEAAARSRPSPDMGGLGSLLASRPDSELDGDGGDDSVEPELVAADRARAASGRYGQLSTVSGKSFAKASGERLESWSASGGEREASFRCKRCSPTAGTSSQSFIQSSPSNPSGSIGLVVPDKALTMGASPPGSPSGSVSSRIVSSNIKGRPDAHGRVTALTPRGSVLAAAGALPSK